MISVAKSYPSAMCGRYTRLYTWAQLHRLLRLNADAPTIDVSPNWNVPPGTMQPIVFEEQGVRGAKLKLWSFEPPFAFPSHPTCATAEKVASAPMFKDAFRHRRCIVPMSGFYEWKKEPNEPKQPYYITLKSSPIMLAAGIWTNSSHGPSFAMITTTPNTSMAQVHDRMPVFLNAVDLDAWLGSDQVNAASWERLKSPCDPDDLVLTPVSTRISRSGLHNDSSLIQPHVHVRSKGLFD